MKDLTKKEITKKAAEFIKKCNVVPVVHAKEGGVIYLESLLVDFVKMLNKAKDEHAEENLERQLEFVQTEDNVWMCQTPYGTYRMDYQSTGEYTVMHGAFGGIGKKNSKEEAIEAAQEHYDLRVLVFKGGVEIINEIIELL